MTIEGHYVPIYICIYVKRKIILRATSTRKTCSKGQTFNIFFRVQKNTLLCENQLVILTQENEIKYGSVWYVEEYRVEPSMLNESPASISIKCCTRLSSVGRGMQCYKINFACGEVEMLKENYNLAGFFSTPSI